MKYSDSDSEVIISDFVIGWGKKWEYYEMTKLTSQPRLGEGESYCSVSVAFLEDDARRNSASPYYYRYFEHLKNGYFQDWQNLWRKIILQRLSVYFTGTSKIMYVFL